MHKFFVAKKTNKVFAILFAVFSIISYFFIGFHHEYLDRNYVYEQARENLNNDINLVVIGPNNHTQNLSTVVNAPVISDLLSPFSDSVPFLSHPYSPLVHNETNEEFTTFQYDAINEYMGGNMYRSYTHYAQKEKCDHYILNVTENTKYRGISAKIFEGFIIVDENETPYFASKDTRLTNLDNCRMPLDDTEVAITDFQADLLLSYGLKNPFTSFNSVDDLIGQRIEDYTIVGVYNICDTQKYIDAYKKYNNSAFEEDFIFLYSFVKKIPNYWKEDAITKFVFDLSLKENNLGGFFNQCKKTGNYDTKFIDNDKGLYYNNNVQLYASPLSGNHYQLERPIKQYHLWSFYLNSTTLLILFVLSIFVVFKYPCFKEEDEKLSKSLLSFIKKYGILLSLSFVASILLLLLFTFFAFLIVPMAGFVFTFNTFLNSLFTMLIHFLFIVLLNSCKTLVKFFKQRKQIKAK